VGANLFVEVQLFAIMAPQSARSLQKLSENQAYSSKQSKIWVVSHQRRLCLQQVEVNKHHTGKRRSPEWIKK